MVDELSGRMNATIGLVRDQRRLYTPETRAHAARLVRIRNCLVLIVVALALWPPAAAAVDTPPQFFSALPGFALLIAAIFTTILWSAHRMRIFARAVFSEIAEEHPEQAEDLLALGNRPLLAMPFGPCFPIAYPPAWLSKLGKRIEALHKTLGPR